MKKTLIKVFVLLSCVVWSQPLFAEVALDTCVSCHKEVIEKSKRSRYVHKPFLTENCAQCHIVGMQAAPVVKKTVRVREKEVLEKIRWFRDIYGVANEHWVLFPDGKIDSALYFKAWDGAIRSPLQSLTLPELSSLPEVPNDLQPPVISDVSVPDIRRGISTSVTISWRTDEFTDAEVVYGTDGLTSSKFEKNLSREHQLVLVGLDANRKYQFQIISRDLFGNQSESAVGSFTTDKTYIEPASRREGARSASGDIDLGWQLFRSRGNYLIIFSADRPVSLSLGAEQVSSESVDPVKKEQKIAAAVGHPMLKSQLDTNITVCYSCHSSFKDAYSHPINVFPPSGMQIPEDYPLLPDGRISCMSCHANHGANYEYRLIRERKSELCRGCHRDY